MSLGTKQGAHTAVQIRLSFATQQIAVRQTELARHPEPQLLHCDRADGGRGGTAGRAGSTPGVVLVSSPSSSSSIQHGPLPEARTDTLAFKTLLGDATGTTSVPSPAPAHGLLLNAPSGKAPRPEPVPW